GSDAHRASEIGRAFVEMPDFAGSGDFLCPPKRHRSRATLRRQCPRPHPIRPAPEVARTKELERHSLKERASGVGAPERGATHVEDATIEQLAAAAERTDEL